MYVNHVRTTCPGNLDIIYMAVGAENVAKAGGTGRRRASRPKRSLAGAPPSLCRPGPPARLLPTGGQLVFKGPTAIDAFNTKALFRVSD